MDDEARIRVALIGTIGIVLVFVVTAGAWLLMSEHGTPVAETNAQAEVLGSVVKACNKLPTSARGACLANIANITVREKEIGDCNAMGAPEDGNCVQAVVSGKATTDRALALETCQDIRGDDQAVQTCVEIALRTGKVKS